MPLPARECLEDANRLAMANREQEARLPRWRWIKRKKLNSEWMRLAEYRQWMMRIIREEEMA